MLGVIRRNAARMYNLIEALLRLSRLGHRAIDPVCEIDMGELVEATLDQLRAENPGLTLDVAIGELPRALGSPQLIGQVSYVSPDTTKDQQSGTSYFTVRIMLPEEERRRLAGLQLSSGMPAEVFMQTGSRTMLSYLFKPILDQFERAFVER
jgi:light-regulated signal transduction histidine kinase (bacteriophytochrome)